MNKLIIENRTGLKDIDIFPYVLAVIRQGKISKTSKGKQYCFSTGFKNNGIMVSCVKNNKSDRFIVHYN